METIIQNFSCRDALDGLEDSDERRRVLSAMRIGLFKMPPLETSRKPRRTHLINEAFRRYHYERMPLKEAPKKTRWRVSDIRQWLDYHPIRNPDCIAFVRLAVENEFGWVPPTAMSLTTTAMESRIPNQPPSNPAPSQQQREGIMGRMINNNVTTMNEPIRDLDEELPAQCTNQDLQSEEGINQSSGTDGDFLADSWEPSAEDLNSFFDVEKLIQSTWRENEGWKKLLTSGDSELDEAMKAVLQEEDGFTVISKDTACAPPSLPFNTKFQIEQTLCCETRNTDEVEDEKKQEEVHKLSCDDAEQVTMIGTVDSPGLPSSIDSDLSKAFSSMDISSLTTPPSNASDSNDCCKDPNTTSAAVQTPRNVLERYLVPLDSLDNISEFGDFAGGTTEGQFLQDQTRRVLVGGAHDAKGVHGQYSGQRNLWGLPHGQGRMVYEGGDKYNGNWVNGVWEGQGKLTFGCGLGFYDGEFSNFEFEGYGEHHISFSGSYSGGFKRGKRHGMGQQRYANGDQYIGEYVAGQRHGKGEYQHLDVWSLDGVWQEGRCIHCKSFQDMQKTTELYPIWKGGRTTWVSLDGMVNWLVHIFHDSECHKRCKQEGQQHQRVQCEGVRDLCHLFRHFVGSHHQDKEKILMFSHCFGVLGGVRCLHDCAQLEPYNVYVQDEALLVLLHLSELNRTLRRIVLSQLQYIGGFKWVLKIASNCRNEGFVQEKIFRLIAVMTEHELEARGLLLDLGVIQTLFKSSCQHKQKGTLQRLFFKLIKNLTLNDVEGRVSEQVYRAATSVGDGSDWFFFHTISKAHDKDEDLQEQMLSALSNVTQHNQATCQHLASSSSVHQWLQDLPKQYRNNQAIEKAASSILRSVAPYRKLPPTDRKIAAAVRPKDAAFDWFRKKRGKFSSS